MISVIIPAYNVQNYIFNTLNSLCNQTYKDIEIIVVNDGSTDNTLSIVSEYAKKDKRIKVFNKENGGVTSARIYGIEHSNGDWITFCDADDTVEPTMYEVLIKNANQYNADISHCGYNMVFPSRTVPYHGSKKQIEQDSKKGIIELISGSLIEPSLCNKLYKKYLFTIIFDNNLIDTSIKINEDFLMNYYLFKYSKKSIFLDECFYNYIVHFNSAANSKLNEHHLSDPIKVLEIICTDTAFDNEIYTAAKVRYINTLINTATMRTSENIELIKKYQKSCRKKLRTYLFDVLKYKHFSVLFKLKVVFATLIPDVYKLIHIIYSRITGLDKIYDIN